MTNEHEFCKVGGTARRGGKCLQHCLKNFVHEIGKRRTLVEAEQEAALMRKIENMAEVVVLFKV